MDIAGHSPGLAASPMNADTLGPTAMKLHELLKDGAGYSSYSNLAAGQQVNANIVPIDNLSLKQKVSALKSENKGKYQRILRQANNGTQYTSSQNLKLFSTKNNTSQKPVGQANNYNPSDQCQDLVWRTVPSKEIEKQERWRQIINFADYRY